MHDISASPSMVGEEVLCFFRKKFFAPGCNPTSLQFLYVFFESDSLLNNIFFKKKLESEPNSKKYEETEDFFPASFTCTSSRN
jgi:hypothetical protein